MSTADIFVLGLDDGNLRTLELIPDAQRYRFHPLLGIEETQEGEIPESRTCCTKWRTP
ncbi:hypothetical protein [Nocardia sp. MDA0666]|uniref:hypothetical protein n=1 Tax=Nocardia sp. MDA0666 TaxID=2135448 RepID=UPI001304AA9A|nr:hypothetical protein [Nocardia sp. MDA0666]